ncbi:MAG: crossover junction endodeoxyribonuclease RuvC [Candidatus Moraniibacteriota bacterium]
MSKPLTILGIDPGTALVGWAIIVDNQGKAETLAYGHISTPAGLPLARRLAEISHDLREIVELHQPDEVAVEELFFFKNQKTVMAVSQARGAILLTMEELSVKIFEYTPLQIKQALTGYGRADKQQVQLMVKNILGLKEIPKPDDTADALAIALCHFNSRKMNALNN